MIKKLMLDIVILLRGMVTVVGRLSVLTSGIFCDCKKMLFLGALATSWQKLGTTLSFEALI